MTNFTADSIPKIFNPSIHSENQLIHKGIFSPDMTEYYFTLSDKNFQHFDVYSAKLVDGKWSKPRKAFFNSTFNDHGMSFSPSGNTLYFSSTRPIAEQTDKNTWQIWKSENRNGKWESPQLIELPNLKGQLVSHPSVTESGTIYFHSSNTDYSEMHIYKSIPVDGEYANAERVYFENYLGTGECTPFISPKEDYILFANIGNQLDLMISHTDGKSGWLEPIKLDESINTNCQGNPFVTPDNQFLCYTRGKTSNSGWSVKCVKFEPSLFKNYK